MKRLNGVLAVLINPSERANYDRALATGLTACAFRHPPSISRPPARTKWLQAAAGIAGSLVLLFFLARPAPHSAAGGTAASQPSAMPAPATKSVLRTVPTRSRARVQADRPTLADARRSELPPMRLPAAAESPAGEASYIDTKPARTDELPTAAVSPTPPGHPPTRPTLSGDWLYVPAAHSGPAGLYPPEYIELRISQESGVLRGRYRARYRVTDQAISPTVSFQFAGPFAGTLADEVSLPWIGAGGAEGEVTLRLIAAGALEVSWTAIQMGEALGLISGKAILVRRLE